MPSISSRDQRPQLMPLIDPFNRHLDWYSILYTQYSVDSRSALDQQSVDSWPSVNQFICINQKLVNWRQIVAKIWFKCQPRCWWSVNQVSIESQPKVLNRVLGAFSTPDPCLMQSAIPATFTWRFYLTVINYLFCIESCQDFVISSWLGSTDRKIWKWWQKQPLYQLLGR